MRLLDISIPYIVAQLERDGALTRYVVAQFGFVVREACAESPCGGRASCGWTLRERVVIFQLPTPGPEVVAWEDSTSDVDSPERPSTPSAPLDGNVPSAEVVASAVGGGNKRQRVPPQPKPPGSE